MQTDATTPNIVELTMLGGVAASVGSGVLSANEKEEKFATYDEGYYYYYYYNYYYYYHYHYIIIIIIYIFLFHCYYYYFLFVFSS